MPTGFGPEQNYEDPAEPGSEEPLEDFHHARRTLGCDDGTNGDPGREAPPYDRPYDITLDQGSHGLSGRDPVRRWAKTNQTPTTSQTR